MAYLKCQKKKINQVYIWQSYLSRMKRILQHCQINKSREDLLLMELSCEKCEKVSFRRKGKDGTLAVT
jgi:IS1 family transposase